MRVRFAPSPTGALHIGGIRTALYNYLLAKKNGGSFILRIEDTDQTRFVAGAEQYITEALNWCGLVPMEGPDIGGEYGPYRQSERKAIYSDYAIKLMESGHAYYAFDTANDLEAARSSDPNFMYNSKTRMHMKNSLTCNQAVTKEMLEKAENVIIRLKVDAGHKISFHDAIRGTVTFDSEQLDDKVMLKSDGMPTYHLANVVDDYLMKITHVIRGEEWLPSTAHHVLLYTAFGWLEQMPTFNHLPLILKPNGNGKLSKRDGAKFGIPVFPLSWGKLGAEDYFEGFREAGFLPEAVVNFLSLLGWNLGNDQELFTLAELVDNFSLDHVHKSGARFDYDKAKWFNQFYIQHLSDKELALRVRPFLPSKFQDISADSLTSICEMMKPRMTTLKDLYVTAPYLFGDEYPLDQEQLDKKWKPESKQLAEDFLEFIHNHNWPKIPTELENDVKNWMLEQQIKPGDLMPLIRLGIAGTTQGPGIFEMMLFHEKTKTIERLSSCWRKQ